jgi:integrase
MARRSSTPSTRVAWRSRDDPAGAHEAWKYTTKRKTTDYARWLARELGEDKRVDSVTADELRRLLADGLKPMRNGAVIKGREPSRKMRSYYAATLRGIFAYALAQGWTDLDPAATPPPYWARRKRADDPLRRGDEFLTPDELRAVVEQLRAGHPEERRRDPRGTEPDAAMAIIMAMAGLRPGEAVGAALGRRRPWPLVDAHRRGPLDGRHGHAEVARRPHGATGGGGRARAGRRRARRGDDRPARPGVRRAQRRTCRSHDVPRALLRRAGSRRCKAAP